MTTIASSIASLSLSILLVAPSFAAGVVTQVTDGLDIKNGALSLNDAGTVVVGSSNADLGGLNPGLVPSLFSWDAATGAPTLLWSFPEGVRTNRSALSDDGAWVAFLSGADLTGGNPSRATQLFLRRMDGSETRQLTAVAPGDENVQRYALAGSGNHALFTSSTNPLGTNPSNLTQLFIVDTDGTNLRQLTTWGVPASFLEFGISDDGTRIVFEPGSYPPDGIFAIDADGTNLRELAPGSWNPRISGNGARIAFESGDDLGGQNPSFSLRVWTLDWSGSSLGVMPAMSAHYPSITDDGEYVFYSSSNEIVRARFDGTNSAQVTAAAQTGYSTIEASGDGSRVAFGTDDATSAPLNGGTRSKVMDASGSNLHQLSADDIDLRGNPEMTADGTRLVFTSSKDFLGTNPSRRLQVFRIQTDGTGLIQVTSLTDGDAWFPTISDDGQKIAFLSNANPLGNNPSHYLAPFGINASGTQLTLLDIPYSAIREPVISGNGNWVVFQSMGHPVELMRMTTTGTSQLQITNDGDSGYKHPRIDANGVYVVYSVGSGPNSPGVGIWRVTTSNTARQRITNYLGIYPDVSGNGTRYVWVGFADPLGLNPDGSYEIFSWDSPTNTYRQLTSLPANSTIGRIRISRDGAYVTFFSNAPIFGNTGEFSVPYRLHVATGTIERIGALGATLYYGNNKEGSFVGISSNGSRMTFATPSDTAGNNADGSTELFLVDMVKVPAIRISASSPTIVSWDADPHFMTYDIIRGEIPNLAIAGSTVDLGQVACLGDSLSAIDTSYAPDAYEPEPGEAYFYLVRGTSGPLAGPGSYGQGKGGLERIAGAGECAP